MAPATLAVKAVPVSVKILKDTEETGVCVATRSQVRAQQVSAVVDEVAQDKVVLSPVDTPETSVTGATVSDIFIFYLFILYIRL